MTSQLIWDSLVGASGLTNFLYQGDKPKAGCLICGDVFQSRLDRTADTLNEQELANELRLAWRVSHAKAHTEQEHRWLAYYKAQGRWSTPEAAEKLAAFGIFSLKDLVLSDEHGHALRLARRAPENDADSPTRDLQLRIG